MPGLHHYKGKLLKFLSYRTHARVRWCPCAGWIAMAILHTKVVSSFVVCWVEVCGGYSALFQNCEYGCELLTCKSTWFWENQLRTTRNLLHEEAPCKPWSSEEDMTYIREEFRWNLCESICVASSQLQISHLLYMMFCTYTSI